MKAEYKYNGLGHRISARYDETAPWYHYAYDDRWRIVAMFEDSDTAPTEQFWYHNAGVSGFGGSSYIDDTVLRERDTDGNGTLDERIYYCQNQHHDVVVLTDNSGTVSERANYNAYGEPIGTFTSINNRKGYAGYEIDPNLTELYHVRHRVLNSKLGTWIRRDPLGYVDGGNLYGYVKGNPVLIVDPLGLTSCWENTDSMGECMVCCMDEYEKRNYRYYDKYVDCITSCTEEFERRELPRLPIKYNPFNLILPCGELSINEISDCSISVTFEGSCSLKITFGWFLISNSVCDMLRDEAEGKTYKQSCPTGCDCVDKKKYSGQYRIPFDIIYPVEEDCIAHITGELVAEIEGEVGRCDCPEDVGPFFPIPWEVGGGVPKQ